MEQQFLTDSTDLSLGVDIGGTNTAFGIVNTKGDIIYENSVATKSFETPQALVQYLHHNLTNAGYASSIIGIGIGAPNGNHFTGKIEFAPNLPWNGIIEITQLFQEQFRCKAILTNDANAAAVGEMLFGAAKNYTNFVTITLGTGLGSGIIIDKKVVYGHNGFAGEYGHIRVIPNGRECACGRQGCLETYTSATGVVRSIQELASENKFQSKLINIEHPTSKDVSELAKQGDLFAMEIMEFTASVLGNALADFMCFSNPEAFILFGGCAHAGNSFATRVKWHMEDAALNIYKNTATIKISQLQDKNAAILGTAAIVFSNKMNDFSLQNN